MTYDQLETLKMMREFVTRVEQARELALCLDAHMDDPKRAHGLTDEQVSIVYQAAGAMISDTDSIAYERLDDLIRDIEDNVDEPNKEKEDA